VKREFRRFPVDRHQGLSDGVFAIAMTLLVLDIKLPADLPENPTNDVLTAALRQDVLPSVATFLLSFFVIGSQWLAHHEMFHDIRQVDRRMGVYNLQYLLVIAVMPFPSSVLADHGNRPVAVALYAIAIGLGGLLRARMQWHALNNDLLKPTVDPAAWRKDTWSAVFFGGLFVVSAAVAYVQYWFAYVLWVVVLGGWALISRTGVWGVLRDRFGRKH
jgi:uncharacterized membrane protein